MAKRLILFAPPNWRMAILWATAAGDCVVVVVVAAADEAAAGAGETVAEPSSRCPWDWMSFALASLDRCCCCCPPGWLVIFEAEKSLRNLAGMKDEVELSALLVFTLPACGRLVG